MTYKQCRQEIEYLRDVREYELKAEIQKIEQQYLNQFKYIKEGDPIVLDDEFLGYFDSFRIDDGNLRISCYNTTDENNRIYCEVIAPELEGLRIAQPSEVA